MSSTNQILKSNFGFLIQFFKSCFGYLFTLLLVSSFFSFSVLNAQEDITSIGRIDNKQIYKIGDIFVSVTPGDMIGDCLVTEQGLRCGGENLAEEVNYLSQISETLVDKVNDVRELSEDLGFLRQQLANRESAVQYLNDEIEQLKAFNADLSKQLEQSNTSIININQELEYTKRSNARLSLRNEKLVNETNQLQSDFSSMKEELLAKGIEAQKSKSEVEKRLADQIANLTIENKNYEQQVERLTEQGKIFSDSLNNVFNAQKEQLIQQNTGLQKTLDQTRESYEAKIVDLDNEIKSYREQLTEMAKYSATSEQLSKQNTGLQKTLDQTRESYEAKIVDLDNEVKSYRNQVSELTKKNQELTTYINAANADISFYKDQLDQTQSELERTKNLALVDKQRLDETKLNLQVVELRALVDSLRESVRIKTMQLSQLQSEFSESNSSFSRQAPRSQ